MGDHSESPDIRVVLLVPRRDDDGHRDRTWAWCRSRWERYFPDLPIYEGHHDEGPFNRSAAINTAARLADEDGRWDIAIVIDSDVFLRVSQVRKAIDKARKTGRVTWAHRRWRGFHEDHTLRVLKNDIDFGAEVDREDMDILVERTNPLSWSCCVAIPRKVWDDMGGFDERFEGWGFEDMAFKSVVTGLYGWDRITGDVYHLWHPRSEERIVKGLPATTASREYMVNARLGRRYMIAAYRDKGVGDEVGEILSDELRERHIRNLTKDDTKLAIQGQHLKLPDWSKWWPTLEELRDGAKAYIRDKPPASVTAVITSGGSPQTWQVRSEYLRQVLASFSEYVTGPIVQRVVYSDWPEPYHSRLIDIATPFGFYVVGGAVGEEGDYTRMRQRLWKYLAKRAQGTHVFCTEDDFVFTRPVDLEPMMKTLDSHVHLTQVALLRDACYQDERETGGILGWPEPAFTRRESWVEHKLFWTANASLFRKSLTATAWPSGRHSETLFGQRVLADPKARSAFWGDASEPWITHIGETRAGTGY